MLLALAATLAPSLPAKSKTPKPSATESKDEFQVVGHIPANGTTVSHFFTTQHFSSHYLYAEHDGGKGLTLIDVTHAGQPAVLADVPAASADATLAAVAGTAVLVSTDSTAPPAATDPQTIKIMDLSDPRNPKVAREFLGVTAVSRDDRRGLVYVANSDGIWILQQHLATDPAVEEEYARYVLYSH